MTTEIKSDESVIKIRDLETGRSFFRNFKVNLFELIGIEKWAISESLSDFLVLRSQEPKEMSRE